MGKRKNKDRNKEEDETYIRKKIKKYEKKLLVVGQSSMPARPSKSTTPPLPPPPPPPTTTPLLAPPPPQEQPHISPDASPYCSPPPSPPTVGQHHTDEDEELPEEFLLALGAEGEEKVLVGDPIRPELASRWRRIMNEGLGKEARETIIKKYPTPANFTAATAPVLNAEIQATLSEPSIKRDKRIVMRQNLTGILMTCLGKSLTNILKGNINSKQLIEEINDAAKIAAEIHHQDSSSRKFFSLAGANKTVQEAMRESHTDKFLFGEDCGERIKAAQAIQKNSNTIKNIDKEKKTTKPPLPVKNFKQLNWKGPPQHQQPHRTRGGQQNYQQPRKHYNQPHRKERQHNYKPKSRFRH